MADHHSSEDSIEPEGLTVWETHRGWEAVIGEFDDRGRFTGGHPGRDEAIAAAHERDDRIRAEARAEGARAERNRITGAATPLLASLVHLPDRTPNRGDPGEDFRPEVISREPVMQAVTRISDILRDTRPTKETDR